MSGRDAERTHASERMHVHRTRAGDRAEGRNRDRGRSAHRGVPRCEQSAIESLLGEWCRRAVGAPVGETYKLEDTCPDTMLNIMHSVHSDGEYELGQRDTECHF